MLPPVVGPRDVRAGTFSDFECIKRNLSSKCRIWGWIVYRTTYEDDEKWAQCEAALQKYFRLREYGLEEQEHNRHLDFPIRSDVTKYNKATCADLRVDFDRWRNSEEPLKEQHFENELSEDEHRYILQSLQQSMRCCYFIRVNEESMQSILDAINSVDPDEALCFAWVDIVHANWPKSEGGFTAIQQDNDWPELEGMTTYHVGYQRVAIQEAYITAWVNLDPACTIEYDRPPRISFDHHYSREAYATETISSDNSAEYPLSALPIIRELHTNDQYLNGRN